jgi:hypothetical protein
MREGVDGMSYIIWTVVGMMICGCMSCFSYFMGHLHGLNEGEKVNINAFKSGFKIISSDGEIRFVENEINPIIKDGD